MTQKQIKKIIEKLVMDSFSDGRMLEGRVLKSIKVLKSLSKSDSIFALSEYLKGLKRIERKHTMYLETAFPFTPQQIKRAKKIIEKKVLPAGRQVKITKVKTVVNPDIIGGFKLRVGDEVWDESILSKITQIKEAIAHGRLEE